MKLSMREHIDRFQKQYGPGEVKYNNGRLDVPLWLSALVLHLSGVKSRKHRIVKKTVVRKINEMLENATVGDL